MKGETKKVHIHILFQNLIFLKIVILSQDDQPLPLYESSYYVNHNIVDYGQSNLYFKNIHFFMHASIHTAYIYCCLFCASCCDRDFSLLLKSSIGANILETLFSFFLF